MQSCQTLTGRKIRLILISFMLLILAGCANEKPISRSFNELLYESEPIDGDMLDYHGVLSIAGLLPIEETGTLYHYPPAQIPATAIGLSRRKSYRLNGTILSEDETTIDDLCNLRNKIEEMGRLTQEAINLLLEEAKAKNRKEEYNKLQERYQKLKEMYGKLKEIYGNPNETDKKLKEADTLQKETDEILNETDEKLKEMHGNPKETDEILKEIDEKLEEINGKSKEIDGKLKKIDEKLKEIDEKLKETDTNLEKIDENLKRIDQKEEDAFTVIENVRRKKGVMIVNWNVDSLDRIKLEVGLLSETQMKNSYELGGFAVLGDIRISCLFLGSDFKDFYLHQKKEEQKLFKKDAGVVTYTLQAKKIVYGNQLMRSRTLAGYLELEKTNLEDFKSLWDKIDTVRLEGYFQWISQLNNSGTLGGMNRKRDNVDFLLDEEYEKNFEHKKEEKVIQSDEWLTIHAILTYADKVYEKWDKIPIEEYFYLSRPEPLHYLASNEKTEETHYSDFKRATKDLYWQWYLSTLQANRSLRDASKLKNLTCLKKDLRKLNNAIDMLNIRLNKHTITENEFTKKVGFLLAAINEINCYVQVPSDWKKLSDEDLKNLHEALKCAYENQMPKKKMDDDLKGADRKTPPAFGHLPLAGEEL